MDVLAPRLSLLTPAMDGAGVGRSGHLVQKVLAQHLLFTRCGLRTYKENHTGGLVGGLGWESGRKMEDVSVVWSGAGVERRLRSFRWKVCPAWRVREGGEAGAQAAKRTW